MQYSRAGLVALLFALIISLVSAVPIPDTESIISSTLSSRSIQNLNEQDRTQLELGAARIPEISLRGRTTTLPRAAKLELTRRQIPIDVDEQLVRRNIFSKIKHAFQSLGHKIKSGFQKAGSAIKKGFQKAGGAIKKGFQKVGGAIKKGFQKAGGAIKKGFQKVKQGFQKAGSAIKKGFQKAGHAIKKVAQKVGNGIKHAAKKVWHFVKTTGAKVAKFGLKVVQSVGEVVGHVASFIPGIGKPIQQAIHGVTKVAGVISDHIHVKLGAKLEKGMKIMNKADQIMDYIPRRREFLEEEVSRSGISVKHIISRNVTISTHWKIEKNPILRLTDGIFTRVMIWIGSEHVQLEIQVYALGYGDIYTSSYYR
jgi:hypothetical protein